MAKKKADKISVLKRLRKKYTKEKVGVLAHAREFSYAYVVDVSHNTHNGRGGQENLKLALRAIAQLNVLCDVVSDLNVSVMEEV